MTPHIHVSSEKTEEKNRSLLPVFVSPFLPFPWIVFFLPSDISPTSIPSHSLSHEFVTTIHEFTVRYFVNFGM